MISSRTIELGPPQRLGQGVPHRAFRSDIFVSQLIFVLVRRRRGERIELVVNRQLAHRRDPALPFISDPADLAGHAVVDAGVVARTNATRRARA